MRFLSRAALTIWLSIKSLKASFRSFIVTLNVTNTMNWLHHGHFSWLVLPLAAWSHLVLLRDIKVQRQKKTRDGSVSKSTKNCTSVVLRWHHLNIAWPAPWDQLMYVCVCVFCICSLHRKTPAALSLCMNTVKWCTSEQFPGVLMYSERD